MFSFYFRGKNSYTDFGIVMSKRPPIPAPQRNVDYEKVPGRNGSLTTDYGTYDDITITIECAFIEKVDFKLKANEIKAWLMGGKDRLIFSDETDKYYEAQVVNKFDIAQSIRVLGEFPVVFNCKPFKYAIDDIPITITKNNSTIYNPGTFQSEPVIKVYGSGDIKLKINNEEITIKNIEEYVTIDSDLMDCYKNTQLWNNNMIGEFPTLVVGENNISWTGNVTKLEINPNWRWL